MAGVGVRFAYPNLSAKPRGTRRAPRVSALVQYRTSRTRRTRPTTRVRRIPIHRHAYGMTDVGVSRCGRRIPRGRTTALLLSLARGIRPTAATNEKAAHRRPLRYAW